MNEFYKRIRDPKFTRLVRSFLYIDHYLICSIAHDINDQSSYTQKRPIGRFYNHRPSARPLHGRSAFFKSCLRRRFYLF